MRLRGRLTAVAATIGASLILTAGPSVASDWGGIALPNNCSDAATIKTVAVNDWLGRKIGSLDIRWSYNCYANWARVTMYGNWQRIAVSIHSQTPGHTGSPYQAGADEQYVSQAWTRLVATASDPVCAYTDVQNGPTSYSAWTCAS